MSARDDLFHRLVVEGGLSPHWANRQIDAFAHELAEQQREWAREHGVMLEDDRYVTAGDVIDQIDPHVGSGNTLSSGSVQIPPGAEDRYPPEVIASMNQGPTGPSRSVRAVETSANYTGRGLDAYRKPPTA